MVQYRTNYRKNPSAADAGKLVNYCVRGEGIQRVERASGVLAADTDIDGFEQVVQNSEMCRMHTISFAEDREPDELTNDLRGVLKDHLDGWYLVGVDSGDGNNHLHVAEAGDRDSLYRDREDIAAIRKEVAEEVGESVAADQVKA